MIFNKEKTETLKL